MTAIDYENLYHGAKLRDGHNKELTGALGLIVLHSSQYADVASRTGIPWLCVAAIHFRESGLKFDRHLHNGDPLTGRTTHVPANRPANGVPPFTWVDSAVDALSQAWRPSAWSLGSALQFLEHYNGMNYGIKHGINSPYLWSYTDAYSQGLYVSDGSFDPNAVSQQAGCAALFKWYELMPGVLDFGIPTLLS